MRVGHRREIEAEKFQPAFNRAAEFLCMPQRAGAMERDTCTGLLHVGSDHVERFGRHHFDQIACERVNTRGLVRVSGIVNTRAFRTR